jgi:hypothetical protein
MTTLDWACSFIPTSKRKNLVATVEAVALQAGYQPYNPFPGGSGTPMGKHDFIRLFAGPKQAGWIRLLGPAEPAFLAQVAQALQVSLIYAWISRTEGRVELMGPGSWADFLQAGYTEADFDKPLATSSSTPASPLLDLAQQQGVQPGMAQQLIQKTTQGLAKRLSHSDAHDPAMPASPSDVLQGFSWNQASAQRVSQHLAYLTIPSQWRDPSLADLAAAYSIACQLERTPQLALLPSDEVLLDKVAYPLDYTPLYFAR